MEIMIPSGSPPPHTTPRPFLHATGLVSSVALWLLKKERERERVVDRM